MEVTPPTAAPAANGAIDQDALNKAITAALGPAIAAAIKPLADNQRILAETLAKLPPAQPAVAEKKEDAKPLTAEDVTKLVADAMTKSQQLQQQTNEQRAAREQFVGTRLKNLPAAYQQRLGNDPAKFEQEAQAIANEFKADAEKLGWKVPDVGGDTPGGQSPAMAAPDLSKMSPTDLAVMALKTSTPVGPGAAQQPQQQKPATA